MRAAPVALKSFLEGSGRAAVMVDLYTFALVGWGTTRLRYSGGNTAIVLPASAVADSHSLNYGAAYTFVRGPRFGRSKVSTKIGVEPTELDLEIYPASDDLVGSLGFADAVRQGIFDGAVLELDRLFAPADGGAVPATSLGVLVWFYGRVAECEVGRSTVLMKVRSMLGWLAGQQMPRRLFGPSCGHVFGGSMCGYDRVNGNNALGQPSGPAETTVTAAAGTTQGLILTGVDVSAYNLGTVKGASGANTGISRTIANTATGGGYSIGLYKGFPYAIAVGDSFTLQVGCDHSLTGGIGCQMKNNLARYGGFPYIPPPEKAV